MIESNQDVNPGFPSSAGRTPLAKVRTFLAERRSLFACQRTSLARGRTGLAFIRTGISFIALSVLLFRVLGEGFLNIFEAGLLLAGIIMTADGLRWYLPTRRINGNELDCSATEPTWGSTVLELEGHERISRTDPIAGAEDMRGHWNDLSPVMRRRFLASDRTDFAEERTVLACYRTVMARARTGLAFSRTGIAFAGLSIAFFRQFHAGPWTAFDIILFIAGLSMIAEGFHWYVPGRKAGKKAFDFVHKMTGAENIWDFIFPSSPESGLGKEFSAVLREKASPGLWATTGLALERTLLAERRNVMARLRTVMARSRTGLAFIRTGMSIAGVGMGLLVYFGYAQLLWTGLEAVLILCGILMILDGIRWHSPAETIRKQFPYCFGDMEITVPDYGKPACEWGKGVFTSGN